LNEQAQLEDKIMDKLQALKEYLEAQLAENCYEASIVKGELCIEVNREAVVDVMAFLHDDANCLFKSLVDIAGVDYPEREERFDVVYQLLSHQHNMRVRVKVSTDEQTSVPSVVAIYPASGWYEREAWDLYGIMFAGNPDLRRILTDYGFDGHPLRKDFPLTGFVEMRYDEEKKQVVYEPVKLPQAYRNFDYLSPWEGAKYALPNDKNVGDEKAGEKVAK
jgi:NADH-quinone oxidoreductase subunit C